PALLPYTTLFRSHQFDRLGANGAEGLSDRRQARGDHVGPADVIEAGDRYVPRDAHTVFRQPADRTDSDEVVTRNDQGSASASLERVHGTGCQYAIESHADFPRNLDRSRIAIDETVAPLSGAFDILRPRQRADPRMSHPQGILREQPPTHLVVRMYDGISGPRAVNQHHGTRQVLEVRRQSRPERTPDDSVDGMLHEQREPIRLAIRPPLAVNEAHQQTQTARRVLDCLSEL